MRPTALIPAGLLLLAAAGWAAVPPIDTTALAVRQLRDDGRAAHTLRAVAARESFTRAAVPAACVAAACCVLAAGRRGRPAETDRGIA